MQLCKYILALCLITNFGNLLADEKEDWIMGLKEAERLGDTTEFFIENYPPRGLVVVHAWDQSPFMEAQKLVGHMALQTYAHYLSVWPAEDENNERFATNIDIDDDFVSMGASNYLILEFSNEDFSKLEMKIRQQEGQLENNEKYFSVGQGKLNIACHDRNCSSENVVIKDLMDVMRGLVRNVKIDDSWVDYGVNLLSDEKLGDSEDFLVKAAISQAVRGKIKVILGDGGNPRIEIHYNSAYLGQTNCVRSVLSVLSHIMDIEDLKKTHIQFSGRNIVIPLKISWEGNLDHKDKSLKGTLKQLKIEVINEKSKVDMEHITSCIIDDGKGLSNDCGYNKFLKSLLENFTDEVSGVEELKEFISDLGKRLQFNKGMFNSIFAPSDFLPGGVLRKLAYQTYHSSLSLYRYSSFEKSFGKPVGSSIKFKNLKSKEYLTFNPKKKGHFLSTDKCKKDLLNSFKLVPSGGDDCYYILEESGKMSLDGEDESNGQNSWATLGYSNFSSSQRFRFQRDTKDKNYFRIVSCNTGKVLERGYFGGVFYNDADDKKEQKWKIEANESVDNSYVNFNEEIKVGKWYHIKDQSDLALVRDPSPTSHLIKRERADLQRLLREYLLSLSLGDSLGHLLGKDPAAVIGKPDTTDWGIFRLKNSDENGYYYIESIKGSFLEIANPINDERLWLEKAKGVTMPVVFESAFNGESGQKWKIIKTCNNSCFIESKLTKKFIEMKTVVTEVLSEFLIEDRLGGESKIYDDEHRFTFVDVDIDDEDLAARYKENLKEK